MITIKNEYLKIEVNDIGAELKSLVSKNNVSYLHDSNPYYWNKTSPILFPIIGKLKDGKTIIENKEYVIPGHGFIKNQDFVLLEQKENKIILLNEYNNETLQMYPYKYKFIVSYELIGTILKVTNTVENIDNKKIYFNLGAHPAFSTKLYENDNISNYRIVFEKEETFDSPLVMSDATLNFENVARNYYKIKEISLSKDIFSIVTIIIPNVKSQKVWLLNNDNKGIMLEFDGFPTFCIWSLYNKEAPFVCLEPWYGNNDHHNSKHIFLEKDNLIKLDISQKFEISYSISIIE
ncbi:MAG: aldose 1-epimerase family protein [Bacilli bacterium]|jgi:galactose mutarotase-like enzyme